jgi:hypothetical protein
VENLEDRMLLSAAPPTVTLELLNDTGDPADNMTADALIGGVVSVGDLAACPLVQVDRDTDGIPDALVFADTEGEFRYDLGSQLESGENSVRARAVQWNDEISDFVNGDWGELLFNYEPLAEALSEIDDLLADADSAVWASSAAGDSLADSQLEYDAEGESGEMLVPSDDPGEDYPSDPVEDYPSDPVEDYLGDPVGGLPGDSVGGLPGDPVGGLPGDPESNIESDPMFVDFELVSFATSAQATDTWILTGTVLHESPGTCTVFFGDLLDGYSTGVGEDGTFMFTTTIAPGDGGPVSAIAKDALGNYSNLLDSEILA